MQLRPSDFLFPIDEQYEKAPAVTRQRLYLETIGQVLPQLGGKVILDADAKQFLPLMNLPASVPQPQQPSSARRPQP
jgi:membrane protease subunit HflK